jgi:hypothetical protein
LAEQVAQGSHFGAVAVGRHGIAPKAAAFLNPPYTLVETSG